MLHSKKNILVNLARLEARRRGERLKGTREGMGMDPGGHAEADLLDQADAQG